MTNTELWVEYAIGNCFILLRLYARITIFGLWKLQLDDVFMVLALLLWAPVTAFIHLITIYGSNVGLTTETAAMLSAHQIESMTLGSKLTFADWVLYIAYIWSLKGAMLSLYTQLLDGLPIEIRILRGVIVFTAASFIACQLANICQCLPVERSWQSKRRRMTDTKPDRPLIIKAKMSLPRKLLLMLLLCSGVFVMVATILRVSFSLKSIQTLQEEMNWGSREMCVAAITVSIAGIKPLFVRANWFKSRKSTNRSQSLHEGGIAVPLASTTDSFAEFDHDYQSYIGSGKSSNSRQLYEDGREGAHSLAYVVRPETSLSRKR